MRSRLALSKSNLLDIIAIRFPHPHLALLCFFRGFLGLKLLHRLLIGCAVPSGFRLEKKTVACTQQLGNREFLGRVRDGVQ